MLGSMTSLKRGIGPYDVVLTVIFLGLGVVLMIAAVDEEGAPAAAVPVFALIPLTLLWRRVSPLGALGGIIAAVGFHIALFGTITRCGVFLPVVFLLVFAAGARLDWRGALAGLGLSLGAVALMLQWDEAAGAPLTLDTFAYVTVFVSGIWVIARLVHARGRNVERLREQTAALREARDERARLEVSMDRAKLAAELDELLQRRLGELAALADRGARTTDEQAATATLVDIEHASRRTLEEMRAVVGVLRSDERDDPFAPQPTLTHLEALLLRAKGSDARLTVEGSPRVLPAGVELSAYRIVEHLLDALDDAPDVSVRIAFGADALDIAVAGPAARRAVATPAIERARERVALHSGTLEAALRGGHAEALVHLPITRTA
jgi:glucose-6-phosphate-specific signal transduction histidine kinase